MNQREAIAEASRYIGVYRWGNGFRIYYPWKDSNRRGPRTEIERHYWNQAQQCAARRRAELALWILCDESERMPENWREWIHDANDEIARKQAHERRLNARQMLGIGVDVILTMCKKYQRSEEVQP